jgi:GntR family transcriptional regulator
MRTAAGIDRRSPVPFYFQLKEILLAELGSDRLSPGDRLPGEHELCHRFGVSRTVVRQALAELELEGRLERRKGRGTFVTRPKVAESLFQELTGLHEDVTARGGTLRSEVRRLERIPAADVPAVELQLEEGASMIVLERLRAADGVPWVVTTTYLPYERCPGLLQEDFSEQSLYGLLEGKYGIRLDHGRRSVEAVAAAARVARDLGIGQGDPVLLLRSTAYDPDGRPVEHFVGHHRGDLSRFEVELIRRAGGRERGRGPGMVLAPGDGR